MQHLVQQTHTVQKGDTFTSIAHKYGVTVEALFDANKNTKGVGLDANHLQHEIAPFDVHGKGHPVILNIPTLTPEPTPEPTPAPAPQGAHHE